MVSKPIIIDTNVLMQYPQCLNEYENIMLPLEVLEELDKINHCDCELKKYHSRQAIKAIENNKEILFLTEGFEFPLPYSLDYSKFDNRILGYCRDFDSILITNDLNMRIKADALGIENYKYETEYMNNGYDGFVEVEMNEFERYSFDEFPANKWGLLENQYLIIRDEIGEVSGRFRWTSTGFYELPPTLSLNSFFFGSIIAKDVYQECAIDSLMNTDFTILKGEAGTAKTLLSLAYAFHKIEKGKINNITIIHNPEDLRGNKKLGAYPGDRDNKLLQTSLGGILSSKLGGMEHVLNLVNDGVITLIPTCDIRGYEVSKNSCLYVTEAQNTDAYTMKTILQRAEEGCKIIIEGDNNQQTDSDYFLGDKNGITKAIEVFKDSPYFSCVSLQNVYRSRIGNLASIMNLQM